MATLTVAQAVEIFDGLGIPCTQLVWKGRKAPPTPYVVLVPHDSRFQYKDGHVWHKSRRYDMELYCMERDRPLEQRISNALDDAGVSYTSDVFIDEENKYTLTYFSTTLIEQEAS